MGIILRLVSILFVISLFNGCKNNLVDPPEIKNPDELVWTQDTLSLDPEEFQSIMQSIWGTSPDNIYVCGHTASHFSNIFHFDGNKWTVVKKPSFIPEAIDPEVVTGISVNDIWLGGGKLNPPEPSGPSTSSPLIAHIDAKGSWKDYPLPHYNNIRIGNIYIIGPNDIWAMGCGSETALFHYDGANWSVDSLRIPDRPNTIHDILLFSMTVYKNSLYLLATKYENSSALKSFYLYKYIQNAWTCIDSSTIDLYKYQAPKFGNRLLVTGDSRLLSYGEWGIYEWDGINWHQMSSAGCNKMVNYNASVQIASTIDGKIIYSNGSTWQEISKFTNLGMYYTDIWTDDLEVFISGYNVTGNPTRSFIWHGK